MAKPASLGRAGSWRRAVGMVLLALAAQAAPQSLPTEHQVKAAFLFRFAQFVEWPASAFDGPQAPIQICIVGRDAFGGDLDAMVRGRSIGARAVAVRRVATSGEARACHVAFVAGEESRRLGDVARAYRGSPTLTVGEAPGFLAAGGMINFVVEEERVRFEVNLGAANEAHLKISSRLLTLARVVQM